ncbi:MAG: hypothetical protein PHX74_10715 [Candidatus Sumerlaeales bacterium]|nr:hypothetical protein [Candidatus Sumerlaeales bacterium]
MDIMDVIKALDFRTSNEFNEVQRLNAANSAIEIIKRHLRWNDDCRPLVPSDAHEAWERNKHFANSKSTALECFEAICDCAVDYDGCRDRFNLAWLIDELCAVAMRGHEICSALEHGEKTAYQLGFDAGKLDNVLDLKAERENAAHVTSRIIKEKMIVDGLTPPDWLTDYPSRKEMFNGI